MATVYLGSPAQVDAGKTTRTRRILYAAGVSGAAGSFRLSTFDSKPFDTPRHGDFIAAVARSPRMPDGALVIGAGVR